MSLSASSGTPKGTKPQPVRRSTKHKRVEFGVELQTKAKLRRERRAARPAFTLHVSPSTPVKSWKNKTADEVIADLHEFARRIP